MCETIKVQASCGCYVGTPKWHQGLDDWHYEPDECGWEAILEVDKIDWEDGCICIHCPSCNAELHQSMDHFQLIHQT